MSEKIILAINRTLLIWAIGGICTGIGGFTSAAVSYANIISAIQKSQEQNKELREIIQPLVKDVQSLQREVDVIKAEMRHLPKITADNLPKWRYEKE